MSWILYVPAGIVKIKRLCKWLSNVEDDTLLLNYSTRFDFCIRSHGNKAHAHSSYLHSAVSLSVEQSPLKFSLTLQQRVAVEEKANEIQNSTDETDGGLVGSYQHTLEPLSS